LVLTGTCTGKKRSTRRESRGDEWGDNNSCRIEKGGERPNSSKGIGGGKEAAGGELVYAQKSEEKHKTLN